MNEDTNHQLVEIASHIPNIKLDIRYATVNNFTGQVLYGSPGAFLVDKAANALARANVDFRKKGYGVIVWDAYRPESVSKKILDVAPENLRNYVTNLGHGSVHNRGCAIDMTLYDLTTGRLLKMPTDFDEFTAQAKMGYIPNDTDILVNRNELVTTMKRHGFSVYPYEWWHYNFDDYEAYPVLDIPFEDLV